MKGHSFHMKVDELRAVLGKYDAPMLKEIVVELYKMLPKAHKEESGLDEHLSNFTREKTKPAQKDAPVNFEALKGEIEQFLDYADKQYYLIPNRYVHKEKRSKWRFEVKRFIKDLTGIGGENSEEAARLLAGIYEMLCYGCSYWIFSTEDPFSSVGYEKSELLSLVLNKMFYSGFTLPAIKAAVYLTLDNSSPLAVLLSFLKTPDTKEMALSQCDEYRRQNAAHRKSKNLFKETDTNGYYRTQRNNQAVGLYLMLKFSLYEYEEGMAYFWANYSEQKKEVALYVLLAHYMSGEGERLNALWIREYEKWVAAGIKPRDYLREEYEQRKEQAR